MSPDLLQQYSIIVNFLGKALGQDYEIVLQDLAPDRSQIAAISNGHISGQKIGSPVTDTALQMLASKPYRENDFLCNYRSVTEDGNVLRSSTMFIKDEDGAPIGLLSINFDDTRYIELHKKLFSVIHPETFLEENPVPFQKPRHTVEMAFGQAGSITENFSMDIPSLMQKMFEDATVSLITPVNRLNQQEKKEIIQKLSDKGLFQLKGAISFVAKHFSCSSATIYRYLSELSN